MNDIFFSPAMREHLDLIVAGHKLLCPVNVKGAKPYVKLSVVTRELDSTIIRVLTANGLLEESNDGLTTSWKGTPLAKKVYANLYGVNLSPTKRPTYKAALRWIAAFDDTTFLDEDDGIPCVTVSMVSALFGVDEKLVVRDLRNEVDVQRSR